MLRLWALPHMWGTCGLSIACSGWDTVQASFVGTPHTPTIIITGGLCTYPPPATTHQPHHLSPITYYVLPSTIHPQSQSMTTHVVCNWMLNAHLTMMLITLASSYYLRSVITFEKDTLCKLHVIHTSHQNHRWCIGIGWHKEDPGRLQQILGTFWTIQEHIIDSASL